MTGPAMRRSPREQRIYILSILCAAVPFAFGLARAFRTGTDFRYLWLAIVAALGTAAVIVLGKARSPNAVVAQSAATFVVATLLAALTAFRLGARAGPGVWVVAVAYGLCFATSSALLVLSRPRTNVR